MDIALPPLPYALNALEPLISSRTLTVHHGKHHAGYINKLLGQIRDTALIERSLEDVVRIAWKTGDLPVFNNAAQAWNHAFFWKSLAPANDRIAEPVGLLASLIDRDFGGLEGLKTALTATAVAHFGSGWVWLVLDDKHLKVVSTANADTPLVYDRQVPLLTIDLWEHAYYLDYQQDRKRYVTGVADELLNWDFAHDRLLANTAQTKTQDAGAHATHA